MKYLSIPTITKSLHRIYEDKTYEHRTGTPASGLLQHYFPINKYITTPEQIQDISRKKPDFTVERLENEKLVPHLFVEIKSLVNSNFNDIMDQLHDTILHTVDNHGLSGGSFSVFIIAMKGTKIAFFEFHSFVSLLDEYNIANYKGFIPLGYNIPASEFFSINSKATLIDYLQHISKVDVPSKVEVLKALGVEYTSKIKHPHIWDLLNKDHSDYVHNLFQTMANSTAGKDIAEE